MAKTEYFLVQASGSSGFSSYLTLSEVAYRCGLHPELIERLVHIGLVDYAGRDVHGDILFHADVIPLIRRILRLRNHLGVNYMGIGVVLELMARIESLENNIRELEERVLGNG